MRIEVKLENNQWWVTGRKLPVTSRTKALASMFSTIMRAFRGFKNLIITIEEM